MKNLLGFLIFSCLSFPFYIGNSYAVQTKDLFCVEGVKCAKDTKAKVCQDSCQTISNCNKETALSEGWRIVSAFTKEVVRINWRTESFTLSGVALQFCLLDRNMSYDRCTQPMIDEYGCTCIGTQYVLEKEDVKQDKYGHEPKHSSPKMTDERVDPGSSAQTNVKGKYINPLSGVTVQNITPKLRKKFSVPKNKEKVIIVTEIEANSPAIKELVSGDIILEINGKPLSDIDEYSKIVSTVTPGDNIQLSILRGGSSLIYKTLIPKKETQTIQ